MQLTLSASGAGGPVLGESLSGYPSAAVLPGLVTYVATEIASALSAELLYVDTHYCGVKNPNSPLNPCWPPRISSRPWVTVTVVVVLIVVVVETAVRAVRWAKVPSYLAADPTCIGGVAAVMGHPDIQRDMAALPAEATRSELMRHMAEKRFRLERFHDPASGAERFGIVMVTPDETKRSRGAIVTRTIDRVRSVFPFVDNWKAFRFYTDICFTVLVLILFGISVAAVVNIDKPHRLFIYYEGSSAIWSRIVFALLGTILARYWQMPGIIQQKGWSKCSNLTLVKQTPKISHHMRPSNDAHPRNTILLSRHILPITAILPLLRRGHIIAASVAFTALMSEIVIVTLAGLPFRPGQTRTEFLICAVISMLILLLFVVELAVINYWRRVLVPHLPRRPDNIAAVMTYLADSKVPTDFAGLETAKVADRNRRIEALGRRYWYGSERGRWMIDRHDGSGSNPQQYA